MAIVTNLDELDEIYQMDRFRALPKLVLGGGSNILLTGNQRKVVVKNEITGMGVIRENTEKVLVKVGAGENWHQFVLWCIDQGYGGVENLSLI
ncbi:MAG: FAD-binding protein, partial [Cyclobacteriaceae bacterium]|nr:FAD-binding protein [Cyclobacteriaceae bacterium HetDA_MAG_MS6]